MPDAGLRFPGDTRRIHRDPNRLEAFVRKLPLHTAVLVAVVALLAACGGRPKAPLPAEPPLAVEVVHPIPAAQAHEIFASGTLQRQREIGLAFLTGGVLTRLDVDEGDVVHRGQLIAKR